MYACLSSFTRHDTLEVVDRCDGLSARIHEAREAETIKTGRDNMLVQSNPIMKIFESKQRLEIPLFQRQYVWNEEEQWQPLWEDIQRKFTEAIEGGDDSPNHFLGAMVLDQELTPSGHVDIRQVIDGQQRLTTIQIFLSALRDFSSESDCNEIATEVNQSLFNTGMMSDPDVDKFKVWPTQLDRKQFMDIVGSMSQEEVLNRYPTTRKKYAKKNDPKPRMVEAYLFFYKMLGEFFNGDDDNDPIGGHSPISGRMEECLRSLKNTLLVAVINLSKEDDPQVIFETLNARGQPLLPADLIRNFIFLRARRESMDIDKLYSDYWGQF